ncbi:MAG: cyclic nucleotide-binding domain-containing protein [Treponema sp.]|nr:cyclic nucleotide-binding domain-containing protein [Treponema sp.]
MKKILISSTNKEILEVTKTVCRKYSDYFDPIFCPDTDESLSFIDYELPEIKLLDFTSKDIDCHRVISAIKSDPWLHNGGIIAVVENSKKVQEMEEQKDPNILIVQTVQSFKDNFDRLLRILWSNQKFLFNRGMQEVIGGEEKGGFVSENDPNDIRLFTSFLVNYLYSTNRINAEGRFTLQTTMMELLTNALEHGNCKISYEEKTACLESGGNILDLIKEKCKDPQIAAKRIRISYSIGQDSSVFCIKDEGDGFDWKSRMNVDFTEDTHGRGMFLSKSMVKYMSYNEKGNEVTFAIDNQKDESNSVPGIMIPFASIEYNKHDIVCYQNEPSTDLYFIVSGRYGVYSDRKLISVLTPNDMFIGEMAFLLNDRRSATIMSAGKGKLIKIPKVSFVNLIRKNPHYGIFLSKLLAQKVVKQNQKTLELQKEVNRLKVAAKETGEEKSE